MEEPLTEELKPPYINGLAKKIIDVVMAMTTQWKFVSTGMAGAIKTGLDYQALEVVCRVYKLKLNKTNFSLIREIEGIMIEKYGGKNGG